MRDRLNNYWQMLRNSLWLLPVLCTAVAALLALAMLGLDREFTAPNAAWVFAGGPTGAREILSTIATSVITVGGVAFSITVVALSLAASQYGPLLLASYLRDPVSQLALGTFVGVFFYCLVILSNVTEGQGAPLPSISVSVGLGLSLVGVAVFVLFIHHLAQSMRPDRLAARIGNGLLEAVTSSFPVQEERRTVDASLTKRVEEDGWAIRAPRSGYLQAVEWTALLRLAQRHELVVRLMVKPGDFITEDGVVAYALGRRVQGRWHSDVAIARRLLVGRARTSTQDPEYQVHQLAEIAVRALSPSMNDPYTALTCIDWLEVALRTLARRAPISECYYDSDGLVRVMAPQPSFHLMANAAFNKLRHAGRNDAAILLRLVSAAGNIAAAAERQEYVGSMRQHLLAVREEALAGLPTLREREEVDSLGRHVTGSLE